MMLKDYLDQNGLSLKAFADICGLSAPTILRARDGVTIPSRRTLQAIVAATNGEVATADLINLDGDQDPISPITDTRVGLAAIPTRIDKD